jgi:distribution and morphology protein 31
MPSNLGRTLYTSFWEAANSLLARRPRASRVHFYADAANTSRSAADFLSRQSARRISTPPPPNSTRVTKSFASGSFLAFGASPSSPAVENGTTCAITSEKIISQRSHYLNRRDFHSLIQNAWRRDFHTTKEVRSRTENPNEHSNTNADISHRGREQAENPARSQNPATGKPAQEPPQRGSSNFHLFDRLPNVPQLHRPTKEELLAAANGFWSRLKIRFKWFSIRSVRPFNLDEITALFSWVLLGHVVWVVVGTTTFFSLLILAINTVFAQGETRNLPDLERALTFIETLAGWVGNYLTKSSGVRVVFESAIVPKWKNGVITFTNVFVSRRPGQGTGNVSKGSSKTAAAAAAAAAHNDPLNPESYDSRPGSEEENADYTQFDVSIESVNVTLSFTKWINGKGLLRDVEVKGIRGVVDRRQVHWPDEDLDPKSYRHEHNPGDFEIDSFKMDDLLVTVYQPDNFRPFSVSIFSCDLPQLRKQWLFYDFLSADMMSGSFDNSLFTIHPRQTHGFTGAQLGNGEEEDGQPSPWKKHSRIRIDGLSIDHLNRGVQGPFSWIHEGSADIVADIMFPADNNESLAKVMADFYDRLEATVTSKQDPSSSSLNKTGSEEATPDSDRRFLVTDLRLNLNNVRAAVPLFTKDLTYMNNALIRPIVAYINSRRTFVPVNCRLVKRVGDFDGSWTIYDSSLMDDLSAAVRMTKQSIGTWLMQSQAYDAFARDVVDEQARRRRFKKVGFWSLQLAAQAIFMGMAGNIA